MSDTFIRAATTRNNAVRRCDAAINAIVTHAFRHACSARRSFVIPVKAEIKLDERIAPAGFQHIVRGPWK
jgi:hypothetical protein